MPQDRQSPHDVGGRPDNHLELIDQDPSFWELKIDAMISLMGEKGVINDWAQLRIGIEALSREDYDSLGYYERWAVAAAEIAIAQNLVSRQQLERRANDQAIKSTDERIDRG